MLADFTPNWRKTGLPSKPSQLQQDGTKLASAGLLNPGSLLAGGPGCLTVAAATRGCAGQPICHSAVMTSCTKVLTGRWGKTVQRRCHVLSAAAAAPTT